MRTIRIAPLPTLLILLAAGCQPPAEEAAPARTAEQAAADIEAVKTSWVEMANAGDAAGVAALFTDDAVYVDPYGAVHQGRTAIEAYYTETFTRSSGWELQIEGSMVAGGMVAGYGTWSATPMAPEGAAPMNGRWQNVSVYQPDGSLEISLSLAMLPAEPPAEM
jgi:ketosteroid isomerase-like protein